MKKWFETNVNICMVLLQIRSTLLGPGLPNLATLVFNRPVRSILLMFTRLEMLFDSDENNHPALTKRQPMQMEI